MKNNVEIPKDITKAIKVKGKVANNAQAIVDNQNTNFNKVNRSKYKVGKHDKIDKVIYREQSPIGITPSSNPATIYWHV